MSGVFALLDTCMMFCGTKKGWSLETSPKVVLPKGCDARRTSSPEPAMPEDKCQRAYSSPPSAVCDSCSGSALNSGASPVVVQSPAHSQAAASFEENYKASESSVSAVANGGLCGPGTLHGTSHELGTTAENSHKKSSPCLFL
jgi:hypothetical protein